MRSSRTARKIVGSLSVAAVSVLLLGGAAAITSDGSAGHGLRTDVRPAAGHGLNVAAGATAGHPRKTGGHGLSVAGHGLSTFVHGLSTAGHGLAAPFGHGHATAGHGLQTSAKTYGHGL